MSRLVCVQMAVALAATIESGCSRSPVAPSSMQPPTAVQPASLSGSWVGAYVVASCPNYFNCGQITAPSPPVGPQPLSLLLNQDGNALSGQVNFGSWLSGLVADVTGTLAPDGTMTLQGGQSWPAGFFCSPAGGWRLTSWTARYDGRLNSINGDFSFVTQKHLSSCYYLQELVVNATSLALGRGTLAEPTFAGHWRGTAVQTSCTTVGWTSCTPAAIDSVFDLNLVQRGNDVSGTLGPISGLPVSGTTDGNTLRLEAVQISRGSSTTETSRLVNWSTRRDAVGRMTGTYRYVREVHWEAGPDAGSTWSTTYNVELSSVVRVPW